MRLMMMCLMILHSTGKASSNSAENKNDAADAHDFIDRQWLFDFFVVWFCWNGKRWVW